MIEKRTVLILGAGSSYEVGFPLGKQLINEIYTLVMGKSNGYLKDIVDSRALDESIPNADLLCRLLNMAGEKRQDGSDYSADFIRYFAEELWNAKLPSIDDFLFHRKEFSLVGEISILFALSKYENSERFKPQLQNRYQWTWIYPAWAWYEYLWHVLLDGTNGDFEKLKQNKLSIITFNYDRSLEYFLFTAIKATYGQKLDEKAVASFFEKIPVRHVYGEMGILPWKRRYYSDIHSVDAENDFIPLTVNLLFRLYGDLGRYSHERNFLRSGDETEIDRQALAKRFIDRAKEIKTYHEVSRDTKCGEILKQAERVYFLGCGYHEQNLKALGLLDSGENGCGLLSEDIEIFGTAVGMSDVETNLTRGYIASFSSRNPKIENKWAEFDEKEPSRITSFFRNVSPPNLSLSRKDYETVSSI